MQQQMGMMQQQQGQMQGLIQKLMLERQGKVIEQQGKASIVKMQEDTKLAVAQMNASKDSNEAIADREIQVYDMLHDAAHETAMQAQEHAHQAGMAQQQQAAAAQQQQVAAQQGQQDQTGSAQQ
jgi:hypothetical protein